MDLPVVPGNANAALRSTTIQPRRAPADAIGPLRIPNFPRRGRGSWPRLSSFAFSSSAFRVLAAVGEEAGAKGSFYDILGITEGGSFNDIKQAYRVMARKYHPDVSPPDRTEEYTRRFIEVQEAYETLSDPRLRALYDRDLARGLHLSFSARRLVDEETENRSRWRSTWQDQLSKLKNRRKDKDSEGNLSWGAQMRRQSAE